VAGWFLAFVLFSRASAGTRRTRRSRAVKDQSGAVIRAHGDAPQRGTVTRVGVTDGGGEYRLPSLPPGAIRLDGAEADSAPRRGRHPAHIARRRSSTRAEAGRALGNHPVKGESPNCRHDTVRCVDGVSSSRSDLPVASRRR